MKITDTATIDEVFQSVLRENPLLYRDYKNHNLRSFLIKQVLKKADIPLEIISSKINEIFDECE